MATGCDWSRLIVDSIETGQQLDLTGQGSAFGGVTIWARMTVRRNALMKPIDIGGKWRAAIADEVVTFYSRDNGQTWFGDHEALRNGVVQMANAPIEDCSFTRWLSSMAGRTNGELVDWPGAGCSSMVQDAFNNATKPVDVAAARATADEAFADLEELLR